MTALPSVEILPPGTRPTEPGWYVVDGRFAHFAGRHVVEIVNVSGDLGKVELHAMVAGITDPVWMSEFTFIARIFPDRIGQE